MQDRNIATKTLVALMLGVAALLSFELTSCHKKNENTPDEPPPIVVPKAVIKSFSPDHGYYGDTITIKGSYFLNGDSVFFGGVSVKTVLENDSAHFKVIIPEGALSGNLQILRGTDSVVSDATFQVDHHIYISGDDYTYGYAAYFVDGKIYICNNFENSQTAGIYASPSDVYVAGWDNNQVVCWQNQVPHKFTTDIRRQTDVKGLFVSGSDVYIVGNAPTYDLSATYWKNGQEVNLTPTGQGSSFGNGIFVTGSDVYVAGLKGNGQALYWKNGVEVPLKGSNQYPGATSIFVDGDDVYVAGADYSTARYWKNGEKFDLTSSDTCIASTNSIIVQNGDVYITGMERSNLDGLYRPVYWKNGVTHFLNEGTEYANATGISVVDGKVYVSGMTDYYRAAYWVDGKKQLIADFGHTSGIYVR